MFASFKMKKKKVVKPTYQMKSKTLMIKKKQVGSLFNMKDFIDR